jgi:hypothetical protein
MVGIHWNTPLNIDLDSNNERQDYKICTVGDEYLWEGEGEQMGLRWGNMIDGLHIWNRKKKHLPIALSGMGRGLRGETVEVI